ncbi:MAG: hypothetical protein PHR45_01175 [Muribaculaceae bacterium]|nr:hypothetical protein [Muribaculaceae bacterium]
MEEKKISEAESLAIITQMIATSRARIEKRTAVPFLVWGYSTTILSIVVWYLVSSTANNNWSFLWFLLPFVNLIILFNRKKSKPMATTIIDKAIKAIWIFLGSIGFCYSVLSFIDQSNSWWNIFMIIVLIMSIGNAITGFLLRYKVFWISASLSIAVSMIMLYVQGIDVLLVFAACFIIIDIIPGHIILWQSRRERA